MKFLLDTNICICLLNGRHPQVERKLLQCGPNDVFLRSIVVSELRFGAENSSNPERNHKTLDAFFSGFTVLSYSYEEGVSYGIIRSYLKKAGGPIGSEDLFIAAPCFA